MNLSNVIPSGGRAPRAARASGRPLSSWNFLFLRCATVGVGALLWIFSAVAFAQSSPFMTGAVALQSNILAWMTPIAIILVMLLGAMAMANRMSWGWCLAAMLGIAITFGAPQIVTWVRGMFGV